MKVLILGNGYIGQRLAPAFSDVTISDTKLNSIEDVRREIERVQPTTVINAAGITGKPNVDWCETNRMATALANTVLPLYVAEVCEEKQIHLIQLSSGCIFYGQSHDPLGWKESDSTFPESYYSKTKYASDLLLSQSPVTAIVRLRLPIDTIITKKNLITKLASYPKVIDVENSVTFIEDLQQVIKGIAEKRATGIFHAVNGNLKYRDLIKLYEELVDPKHTNEWIEDKALASTGLAAKNRSTTVIQDTKLAALGIIMRPVEVALRDTMMKYAVHHLAQHPSTPSQQGGTSFLRETNAPAHNISENTAIKRPPKMKGIILAGGRGTRLAPLTNLTNKHLLPIGNKQMVLYPLQTLLDAGVRDIMIITGPDYAGHFIDLLGSGKAYNCNISYRIQDESGGIAEALGLCEDFVGTDHMTVILGDNIFEDNFASHISTFQRGSMTFYKSVPDAKRFGVMEIDSHGRVLSIEEKPAQPKSNFAQVGLYIYDSRVFEIIKTLKPSGRGELEITDVNNAFLQMNELVARPVNGFWTDAGTFDSLKRATDYIMARG